MAETFVPYDMDTLTVKQVSELWACNAALNAVTKGAPTLKSLMAQGMSRKAATAILADAIVEFERKLPRYITAALDHRPMKEKYLTTPSRGV